MKTYIQNIVKANKLKYDFLQLPDPIKYFHGLGWLIPAMTILFLLSSCGGKSSSAGQAGMRMPRATVIAITVKPSTYTITERFPGTLMANSVVQLRSDVTGYLEAIKVKDGSWVKKGQPLYDIDKSRYQAAYNQASANLQQSEANLAQKQRDLKRYQDLLKHDAIAKQIVDQAGTAVKTSEANVAASKAALSKASTDLNHATLRAPINGKIGIAQVKIGDIINAGQTLVNTIVNDNPMYADFNIPQSDIDEFLKNNKQSSSDKKYYIELADGVQYTEPGKLLVVNNEVDPTTGTIQIRLKFPNKEGRLKSGMKAVVLVRHVTGDSAIAIPTDALVQTLGETTVLALGKENVVHEKQIEVEKQLDSLSIIKGLEPGDRIIINGLQNTRPGDTVNVKER